MTGAVDGAHPAARRPADRDVTPPGRPYPLIVHVLAVVLLFTPACASFVVTRRATKAALDAARRRRNLRAISSWAAIWGRA